ncbi:histidine phosphatase family protein [Streptomyces armeniacus]|uniref:Histidine phosphatase family protein n=1 Tax=Streptomyces armeniacus TaxID=83291 RepID=A0A345XQU3_9ACTN|nr:histidine phosphatase family protein [Streptomyces armeniacus]AXK34009.1 histidine phosphatase family protein [Streptomyces armeniacus]
MSELFLARHGQTVWHAENRYAGSSDIDLTPRGREQARQLGDWAAGMAARGELTAVLSSPLRRCRETAEPAAAATGRPLETDARLRELDFGRGEGLTRDEMRREFGAERAAFERDPGAVALPGGEDPEAAVARGLEALREVAASAPGGGPVLVVAHNTLLRMCLCAMLGIPLSEYRRVLPVLGNCALTKVRRRADGWSLLSYNTPPAAHPSRSGV